MAVMLEEREREQNNTTTRRRTEEARTDYNGNLRCGRRKRK